MYLCMGARVDFIFRANRAQYSDVSFQSISDDDIVEVKVPTMQGTAEDEGWFVQLSPTASLIPLTTH